MTSQGLVAGKRGATKLGFALLLRFYTERGWFPRGRSERRAECWLDEQED